MFAFGDGPKLRFATMGIIAAQNYTGKDAIEQLGL